jgi:hypothetical protein
MMPPAGILPSRTTPVLAFINSYRRKVVNKKRLRGRHTNDGNGRPSQELTSEGLLSFKLGARSAINSWLSEYSKTTEMAVTERMLAPRSATPSSKKAIPPGGRLALRCIPSVKQAVQN